MLRPQIMQSVQILYGCGAYWFTGKLVVTGTLGADVVDWNTSP